MHDVVVASSRLARGDASVAIGVNMHLVILLNIVRRWQVAVAAGDERRAAAFAASMAAIARDGVVMAAAISELGQDLTRPADHRDPHAGGLADRRAQGVLHDVAGRDGALHRGHVRRRRRRRALRLRPGPARRRGVEIHGDWDALGMRASGSHSVTFAGVELPRAALRGGFLAGDADAYMERNLVAGLFHASASLGIAESAAAAAAARSRRRGEPEPRARARCRRERRSSSAPAAATLSPRRDAGRRAGDEDAAALFAEAQAAKTFVNEAAPASSTARSPCRAAPATSTATRSRARTATSAPARFMHPLGANRAYDLLGDVALGREPVLH